MIDIGCFSEMNVFSDNGSVVDYLVDKVEYDKKIVIDYLSSFNHLASCPRTAIDCVTGKEIASSFKVFTDGEYRWCDFLIYHVDKYNIRLPQAFINKIMRQTASQ